ncbi:biosynthetic-type acetolactate synthase large subunit [Clostridium sp. LBM24168]
MKAAEAVIQSLREENVKVVFGYPGATVVPIYEALRKSDIEHILVRQEQAAGHSASGYARSTGKVGVCVVTSGPGATNLITSIAAAYMDSIPLVVITGQVNSNLIGRDVFQELDITGATESFTKYNFLVKDAKLVPKTIKEAFYIAKTGRKGPVLVDIPVDIMNDDIDFEYPKEVNIRGYKPTTKGHAGQIMKIADKIENSKRPLICAGGGIILANAESEFRQFVEMSHIPVVYTLMGKGSIDESSKYCIGLIGTHGLDYANKIVKSADVLILLGARATDRTTCGLKNFAENAEVIHVDIDPAEIGKNLETSIPVVGDLKNIITKLIKKVQALDTDNWLEEIEHYKGEKQVINGSENRVNPKYVLSVVSEMLNNDSILTADVGQNQIWCANNFKVTEKRKFLTSGGLGTMGYSLPAAIGAKIGCPEKKVVAFAGDGGFQMSLFEMGTISEYNVNITIILFNNSGLGMVRQIQDKTYAAEFGVNFKFNPDFVKLAGAYGINAVRVKNDIEFNRAFKDSINSKGAFLIECIVDPHQGTF